MKYVVVFEKAPKNYAAYVPDLPGCIATGASREEVERLIREGTDRLADEVLAVAVTEGRPTADLKPHEDTDLALTFWLRIAGG